MQEVPAPGTCQWIYEWAEFKEWLNGPGSLLLLSAEPWCGKSVLAKSLEKNPPSKCSEETICYYFPCGVNPAKALSPIIQTISSKEPELPKNSQPAVDLPDLSERFKSFKETFEDPKAGDVICVLDALDECDLGSLRDFVQNLKDSICRTPRKQGKLKFLATTRPEEYIFRIFENFEPPFFKHLPLPTDYIKKDVDTVVNAGLEKLNLRSDRETIRQALYLDEYSESPYLWSDIVLEVLRELSRSTFQAKEWRDLRNTSSQEAFKHFRKFLEPFEPSTTVTGQQMFKRHFKSHEHPSYATVKRLLSIHLKSVLTSRPQRLRFKWTQKPGKLHPKALSDDGPSLAVVHRTLYAVWRGQCGEGDLWWAKVEGGTDLQRNWSEPRQIEGARTDSRPSIAAMENGLFALWKSYGKGKETLQYSVFDHTKSEWKTPAETKFGSKVGPAVTLLEDNKVCAAWRGTEGDDLLWRATFDGEKSFEKGWCGQYPDYIDINTNTRPALASCRGRLYLAWTSLASQTAHQILVSSLEVNTDVWDQPSSVESHCHSDAGPSLARFKDTVYAAWRGKGNDTGIWLTSSRSGESGHFDRPQRLEDAATDCTPAVVEWENELVLVWKGGWGNDRRLWWGSGRVSTVE